MIGLNDITREDIAAHLDSGSENAIGVTVPVDFFKGKPLREAVRGWCTLNLWIEHNTPWVLRFEYAFENGAEYRIIVKDKASGNIIKNLGWNPVKGSALGEVNFGKFFEEQGFRMAFKLARKIERALIQDGAIIDG